MPKDESGLADPLREAHERLYDDVKGGLGGHQIFTGAPTVTNLLNGQVAFYTSGGNVYLAANVSGTLRKVQIT